MSDIDISLNDNSNLNHKVNVTKNLKSVSAAQKEEGYLTTILIIFIILNIPIKYLDVPIFKANSLTFDGIMSNGIFISLIVIILHGIFKIRPKKLLIGMLMFSLAISSYFFLFKSSNTIEQLDNFKDIFYQTFLTLTIILLIVDLLNDNERLYWGLNISLTVPILIYHYATEFGIIHFKIDLSLYMPLLYLIANILYIFFNKHNQTIEAS